MSYKKKLFYLFLFGILTHPLSILSAQKVGKGNYNYLDFQKRNYYFGITLAYNQSDYRIFKSKNYLPNLNDSIAGILGVRGPGFNLQVVSNLRIGENFDIRFLPGFSFAERTVEYDWIQKNKVNTNKRIESVFVELPFHVRYKSAPYHDKRLFVMGGLKYSFDIQANSRSRTVTNNLRVSPTDFQVEIGAGIQMFFPYFIFSPEIKFSHGLGNILIFQNGLQESTVIEKLMSRGFTISLHFEG
ncbi:MAG: PorT family protein [Saprospiraceae bacterium]|nr:PorT family protein [Saprospiraceae bacterium]